MAYDQLEFAPNDWRNPITRNALKVFNERAEKIQNHYIELMAQHISSIGRLKASDITRLDQMRRLSRNMNEIQKEIAKAANISDDELQEIFKKTCEIEGNSFLQEVMASGNTINWEENDALKTAMQAQVRVTQGKLVNFSNTTANSKPYVQAVDQAILECQSGLVDPNTAIRNAIKKCAAQGLTVVQYETKYKNGEPKAYHRRLDSAMRQNVLDGIRDLAQERLNIIGREIGCDGIEISAHLLCAEDHLEGQGQQMKNSDFEALQGALRRPFGEWNCRHWWTPIIIGISPATYTDNELEQYKQYSREKITITSPSGKEITKSRYQWTQEQRRLETAVRQQKDIITAAKASNPVDMQTIQEAKNRIKQYQSSYSVIGDKAGIGEQRRRMTSYKSVLNIRADSDKISLPIESRKTDSGNPSAIVHFDSKLSNKQQLFLDRMKNYDSSIIVRKKDVSLKDISALTAKTGCEFALFTKKGKRLIVRGDSTSVNIDVYRAKELKADGWKWSGHSHPGTDINVRMPSGGDKMVLNAFEQEFSVICDSTGRYMVFDAE